MKNSGYLLTPASTYTITGYARGDGGLGVPYVAENGVTLWTGTNNVAWQQIPPTTFTAVTDHLDFYGTAAGAGWAELTICS